MTNRAVPVPETGDEKEVYAFAGLAFYWAQVLEREVMHFIVASTLVRVRPVSQAELDAIVDEPSTKTFGQLLNRAQGLGLLAADLADLLKRALKERNRLTHSFFYDHGEHFLSHAGREVMFAELRSAIALFKEANALLEPITLQVGAKYGLTKAAIDHELAMMIERAGSDSAAGAT